MKISDLFPKGQQALTADNNIMEVVNSNEVRSKNIVSKRINK